MRYLIFSCLLLCACHTRKVVHTTTDSTHTFAVHHDSVRTKVDSGSRSETAHSFTVRTDSTVEVVHVDSGTVYMGVSDTGPTTITGKGITERWSRLVAQSLAKDSSIHTDYDLQDHSEIKADTNERDTKHAVVKDVDSGVSWWWALLGLIPVAWLVYKKAASK